MTAVLMILVALLAAVLFGAAVIASTLALGAAFGAAFAWGFTPVAAACYERRQRRSLTALQLPPSQTYRPCPSPLAGDVQAAEYDSYWTAARLASVEAEHAAPVRDGHTQPLPDVTRAVWSGVVADPSALPWTAPVSGGVR